MNETIYIKDTGEIRYKEILVVPTHEIPSEEQTYNIKYTNFEKYINFLPNNEAQIFSKICQSQLEFFLETEKYKIHKMLITLCKYSVPLQ